MLVYCGEYDAALLAMLNRKYWSFLTVLKSSLITQGHWPKSFIKRLQYHCIYHLEKKCFWYVTKLVWIIKSCLKYSHQTKLSLFTCSAVYRTKVLVAVSNVKSYKKMNLHKNYTKYFRSLAVLHPTNIDIRHENMSQELLNFIRKPLDAPWILIQEISVYVHPVSVTDVQF